jgi:hypothetical protein
MAGALYIFDEVLSYVQDPTYLSQRMVASIERETQVELSYNNQPITHELEVLFACIQNPHPLTLDEKRVVLQTLATFADSLRINRMDIYDIREVYGIFSRETNGIVRAFGEQTLPTSTLIKKVLIFSLLISTGKVRNFEEQYQIYRSITTMMSQTDTTLRPLLELLTDQLVAPSLENILSVFAQIYGNESG